MNVSENDTDEDLLKRKTGSRAPSISHTLSTGSIGPDQRWLVAHNDPAAGYYTFSSGITFGDFCTDGEMRLAVADLGNGQTNAKLNIYHGTKLLQQIALIVVPAGIASFYQDGVGTTAPALAVAAGQFLFIYKNLRPFYKFQLPFLDVNQTELEIWGQVKEEKIEIESLHEVLHSLRAQIGECELTSRSQRFLELCSAPERESFVQLHKMDPLKRSTTITCLTTLKKSVSEENAATCLIIGTEDRDILVIEPDAFTVLASIKLPSVPVFIESTGLFDVEFRITISCRDAAIYSLKRGFKNARLCVQLSSQPVGIVRVNNYIVAGCMDQTLSCYTTKGNMCWTLKQPCTITSLTTIHVEILGLKLVAVALTNCTITIYQEKYKVDLIFTDEPVVAMKFGKYGREGSTLVTISTSGSLCIRILKRTAKFQPKEIDQFDSSSSVGKLSLPKKTKIFVDQTMREREESTRIHRAFQQDLFRLKLTTARAYVKALTSSLAPITATSGNSLKLSAEVHGLGPTFRLVLQLCSSETTTNLFLAFHCNINIYWIERNYIQVSHLAPGMTYSYSTHVQCVSELNVSDQIKVYVVREGETVPILTAIINMPQSEAPIE